MDRKFSALQRRILLTCVLVYTTAYAGRMNLSAALHGIASDLSLSMARAGFLQTVFAIIYAAGQMVNGTIVDHLNPAKYMLVGIAGTAACNMAMGFGKTYSALLAIWSLNAVFQSMMWTPIMRLLAMYFPERRIRERANEVVALTLIVGHLISWAISGFVSGNAGWRYSFVIPACAAFVVAASASFALRGIGTVPREKSVQSVAQHAAGDSILRVFSSTGFYLVLGTCILHGFIRDGAITWTPTILYRMDDTGELSPAVFSLVLPVLNFIGVMIGFSLRRRGARPYGVVAVMMAAAICCGLPLMGLLGNMVITAALLGCMCAAMYGANTMLTGLIPFEYNRIGKTGMTAGLVDSMIYAGSALAGALAGGIYEGMGTIWLVALWVAAAAVSIVLMHISGKANDAYWKRIKNRE